jgi:hypothetical protein
MEPTAIVLIAIASVLVVGSLFYLVWPMLESLWKAPNKPAPEAAAPMQPAPERAGTELPPLLTPV